MSVINKMLRDLDHRKAAQPPLPMDGTAALPLPATATASAIAPGWATPPSTGARVRPWVWMLALCCVVAMAVVVWQWWPPSQPGVGAVAPQQSATTSVPATPALASLGAAAVLSVPVAPSATPSGAVVMLRQAPVPAGVTNIAAGGVALRMEETLSARRALDALLTKPVPVAAATPVAAASVASVPRAVRTVPAAATAATAAPRAPPTPAQTENTPTIQRQQQAGGDALVQAQNLWNTGSRDAAMELMQQSLAAAERTARAGSGPATAALLVPLVREMARMQLAEGRHGAVWEMLTRLEALLGNQADLWAIRANAAQRLGRHQDSVHAYMVALQSRPDEQRWLLGAAVSLAALGQTTAATDMAERARAVGPVGKEVMSYLRQTGVVLKD